MASDRLSSLDASYLYLDSPVSVNQGVGVNFADGPIPFERLLHNLERKIERLDRFRQVATFVPGNLAHPTWEWDPAFDLRNHVHHVRLEPPGTEAQLREFVEQLLRRPLDRRRPLWAIHVIEGLASGRGAMITQLHHCVSDGMGGRLIASVLFDFEPDPELDPPAPYSPPPVPSPLRRLVRAIRDDAVGLVKTTGAVWRSAPSIIRLMFSKRARPAWRLFKRFQKTPGVKMPFNAPLCGRLSYALCALPIAQANEIRDSFGGTLNDVLLACVGTAMTRYAARHEIQTLGKQLKVLVPTNVRAPDQYGILGNYVSILPVAVPLDGCEPAERLQRVFEYTAVGKESGLAIGISIWMRIMQTLLTPPLMRISNRFFASSWLQRRQSRSARPPFLNMVVTSLPGTEKELFIAGRKVLSAHLVVPLLPSMGLVCAAVSFRGTLYVTFAGDAESCPDVELLKIYLEDAFEELYRGLSPDREPSVREHTRPAVRRAARAFNDGTGL